MPNSKPKVLKLKSVKATPVKSKLSGSFNFVGSRRNILQYRTIGTKVIRNQDSAQEMERRVDKVLNGKNYLGLGNLFEEAAELQKQIDARKKQELQTHK